MKSISLKIIIIIIAALAVLNTSVLLLANWQIRKIITKNQVDLRTEQIGQIIAYIKSKHDMLKKKGLLEAMGSNARDGILRDLNKIWYNNRNAFGNPTTEKDKIAKGEDMLVYPYIMNQNGKLILHPYLPEDKRDISDQEFVKKMLAQKDGELSYEWNGQQKWMIFRSFDGGKDWKWRVAYSIYNKVKFADARELFFNLLMIMVGITVLIIIILAFYMTNQIARPVRMLTECAKKAATGDVDMMGVNEKQLESVRQRKDELGNTLRAFDTLLTAQKEKINVAQAISAGDLTCHVNISSEHDKLGIALRAMNQRLNEMVQSISTTATSIASGSQEISSSSQLLSDGATRQAASLQEISSSMTDMATQAKTSAEGAEYAQSLSIDARDSGKTGNAKMTSLVEQMGNINVSADSITKVIKTIDSIAFQTNLLALNAAVEAARAGNHGKGFAVVAEEVRNLASRSAKAAQETAKLIQKTVDMITQGNEMAKDTATVLEQIVENTTKVADIAGEAAATSNEQAQGIAQITQGVQQVSDVTQQNTASAEEAASASSEMASLAAQLQALVNRFQLETQTEAAPAQHIAPISRRAPKLSTQAKPRHIPPAPKQQPTQQKNIHDDWGQSPPPKAPANPADIKGTVIDDSIEIKLDDEEFGKY